MLTKLQFLRKQQKQQTRFKTKTFDVSDSISLTEQTYLLSGVIKLKRLQAQETRKNTRQSKIDKA